MPNWCHNTLIINGPSEELANFVNKARPTPELMARAHRDALEGWWPVGKPKPTLAQWFDENCADQPLTFEAFAPQPDDVDDWYSWRCIHWSTKWDACFDGTVTAIGTATADPASSTAANGLCQDDDEVSYRFDTAWSPPVSAVAAMAAQHPHLTFRLRYGEVGSNMAGEVVFRNGECESDCALDIDDVLAPEQMWF